MRVLCLNPPSKTPVARDLLYGCWCAGKRIARAQYPPLSLLYIATALKESHDAELLDAQGIGLDIGATKKRIEKNKPDAIILPVSGMTLAEDTRVLAELKKENDFISIAYGPDPTFLPKETLEHEEIDIVIRHDPEKAMEEIASGKDLARIRGIGYKDKKKAVINRESKQIEDLDDLPIPDRGMLPDIDYPNPLVSGKWTTALASRGCNGKCTFCTSPKFHRGKTRQRSPENVIEELAYLASLGYEEVLYRDETFTYGRRRLTRICELMIKENTGIRWTANARIGTINHASLRLMKKAGCVGLKIGVESGVQEILDRIGKGIKIQETEQTFKETKKLGIKTHAHLMLGCPGETDKTAEQTIRFAEKIDPTTATFGAFKTYPGSRIYEQAKGIDRTDGRWEEEVKKAYKRFYLRPGYALGRLKGIRSPGELKCVIKSAMSVIGFTRE